MARLLLTWSDESKPQRELVESRPQVCHSVYPGTNGVFFVVVVVVVLYTYAVYIEKNKYLLLGNGSCVFKIRVIFTRVSK